MTRTYPGEVNDNANPSDKKGKYYEFETLNSKQLIVPRNTYQRSASNRRVQHIVDNFDERVANDPKVSCRDGKYYVFDGQHTIAARKLRNNNQDLPIRCKVYYGLSESEEALLFAEQTGVSAPLTPGAKMRARVYGGDPEAVDFKEATEDAGVHLNYDQKHGKDTIGCVATAYDLYRKVGEECYKEGLAIIKAAWGGDPESFRAEILNGVILFVYIYHGEYDILRLITRLSQEDPLTIYREGRALGNNLAGSKKYIYQVWKIYNGKNKTHTLQIRF